MKGKTKENAPDPENTDGSGIISEQPPESKKNNKPGKQTTEVENEQRISEIVESLLMATPIAKILDHFSQKYKCSQRQIQNYIKTSRKKIQEDAKIIRQEQINEAYSRRLDNINIIKKQLKKKYDNATARELRAAEIDLGKFIGAYKNESESETPEGLGVENFLKLVDELVERKLGEIANKKINRVAKKSADMDS